MHRFQEANSAQGSTAAARRSGRGVGSSCACRAAAHPPRQARLTPFAPAQVKIVVRCRVRGHRRDGSAGRRRRLLNRGRSGDGNQGQGQPVAADHARGSTSTAASLCRPPLAVVVGTPPAHLGCAGGVGRPRSGRGTDRPSASRWEETRGTGLGATTASLRRRSWRARSTRRFRASVRAATPMKLVEGLTRRGLPAWPRRSPAPARPATTTSERSKGGGDRAA